MEITTLMKRHPAFLAWAQAAIVGTTLAFLSNSSALSMPVHPEELASQKPLEIGQLVLVLMPDTQAETVSWDHRLKSEILWKDDGYRARTQPGGGTTYMRQGLIRTNIQGKYATVLRQSKEELGWTVLYRAETTPKFGPEEIVIEPDGCFGAQYEGCAFDPPLKSLTAVSIKYTKLCGIEGDESVSAYLLTHKGRRATVMMWRESTGSGGSSAWITLKLIAKPLNRLCSDELAEFSTPSSKASKAGTQANPAAALPQVPKMPPGNKSPKPPLATEKTETISAFAQGISYVPGSIICPNYATFNLMFDLYGAHAMESIEDAATKGQSRLLRGAPTAIPNFAQYGCALVPPGTPLQVELGNIVPVVTAKLPNGKLIKGVTHPSMIQR